MINDIIEALPNHDTELERVTTRVNKLTEDITKEYRNQINGKVDKRIVQDKANTLFTLLFYVGELGMTRDPFKQPIEDYYTNKFKKTPSMGNKLKREQLDGMYKPYDKLKQNIWKVIEKFNLKYDEDLM